MDKIMYIGNVEHIRLLLHEELTEAGYDVVMVSDTGRVAEDIKAIKPHLIILDRDLEKGDAFEILSELRNSFYELPIIFYSAYDTFRDDVRTIAADFCVVKSFDLTELKKKIAMALQVSYQSYESQEEEKAKVTEMVTARVIELINYQAFPNTTSENLPILDSLILDLNSKQHLGLISEGDVHSIYNNLILQFAREVDLVRRNAIIELQQDESLIETSDDQRISYLFHKWGSFSVLSLPRFSHELESVFSLIKIMEAGGFRLTGDVEALQKRVVRSIEFPPEYHQAGIHILNYFGTVLRKKYPDVKAKVRIEQEGLRVTMIVDPLKGNREVIEHALDEYGLVVRGQISLAEYSDDRLLIVDLKNQLRLAASTVAFQRDILDHKNAEIETLKSMLGEAIKKPVNITLQASPKAELYLSQNIQTFFRVAPMISQNLKKLTEKMPQELYETETMKEIEKSFEKLENSRSREEVENSPAILKLRELIEQLSETDSKIGKTIKGIKGGVKIAQNLAEYYNEIADWCGLPRVPKPFLRKL